MANEKQTIINFIMANVPLLEITDRQQLVDYMGALYVNLIENGDGLRVNLDIIETETLKKIYRFISLKIELMGMMNDLPKNRIE